MSESNQNYKNLAIPHFREVFELIDDVLKNRSIPYYLIGVNAIALEMLRKGIKPARGTKDIDFAIMISSLEEYHVIVEELQSKGFSIFSKPWRLNHKKFDVLIDILPFGDIEMNKQQGFNELYTDLHVLGFNEVLDDSSEYDIEDRSVKVPPLPGMVLLKLIAWSDRPEKRHDDLFDILYVIDHYHDLEFEKIIMDHHELIPEEGEFDERVFSARVLGRRAKEYVDKSKDLRDQILNILDENTLSAEESKIAKKWSLKRGWDLEYCTSLLTEFKTGLSEGDS